MLSLRAAFGMLLSLCQVGCLTPVSLPTIPGQACDISAPIAITIKPMEALQLGAACNFEVQVQSELDPDDVTSAWIEYEIPPGLARSSAARKLLAAPVGPSRHETAVVILDERRQAFRARLVVTLADGTRISESAVYWIDLGRPDPPLGLIRRIQDPDGTGLRVYRGVRQGQFQ